GRDRARAVHPAGQRPRGQGQHHGRDRLRRLNVSSPRSTLRLVCFDLDGTLVDSTADIQEALEHALSAVGPADPELDDRALLAAGMGTPLEEFFALARPPGHPAAHAD